ncbi:hypothetical protein HF670_06620 [Acidithiobacillus thiooxidans]|jgi:hypothetical protein|uniref:hypothetical protein n=1 Tax=Acidithiobacillus thiooxidans TaxID=930 RepID=UPI001C06A51A|nr:hypothetical protein [Acidithiobacillus thiooxidans]MBU2839243.1 hypothetical protein [Acidithiobacillus thiooxidans]
MRYYYGYDGVLTDRQKHALFQIVEEYENRSRRICEHCGLPGTLLVRDGYWYVACPEHARGGLTPAGKPDNRRQLWIDGLTGG